MKATPTDKGDHQVGLVIAPNHRPVPKANTKKMPSTVQPADDSGTKVATKKGEISMPAIHRISGMGANLELRPDASESDGGLGVSTSSGASGLGLLLELYLTAESIIQRRH